MSEEKKKIIKEAKGINNAAKATRHVAKTRFELFNLIVDAAKSDDIGGKLRKGELPEGEKLADFALKTGAGALAGAAGPIVGTMLQAELAAMFEQTAEEMKELKEQAEKEGPGSAAWEKFEERRKCTPEQIEENLRRDLLELA